MASSQDIDDSDLTTAMSESDIGIFTEMPDDVQAILRGYEPSDTSDDAVHVLRETFKYLPADGRRNLAQDIVQAGAQGKLQQLAQSIITGLLTPLKVAGDKTAEITPSPRIGLEDSVEDLAAMTDKSMTRVKQQQLRVEALRRDGNKCVISGEYDVNLEDEYPDEVTADLKTAHIIPFAISQFDGDAERLRMVKIWSNMFHYFPSIRSRLNFHYDQINSLTNVMMLSAGMHKQFGRFSMTLEPTDTPNQYRVKTFRRFTSNLNNHLPKDGVVNLICHDGRYPLPSRELLGLHCSVAHILNATDRGVKIDRIMRDYGATGAFARDGSTNIAELLSVSNLTLLPTVAERGFFVAAKERFKQYDAIEYKVLDISRNPPEQGFNPGEYDLVIASNVLLATPILHDRIEAYGGDVGAGNGQKAALSGIMESLEKWKEERSEGLPALWIVHGSGDTMIPPVCSTGFVKRLREVLPSVPVKLDVLPGEHLFDVDITMEEEWVTEGRGFLEHYWP